MPALEILKAFDLEAATVSLWVFKKSGAAADAPTFKGRWVETAANLDEALKASISAERDRIEEVLDYGLLAQNNEASALSITTAETHAGFLVDQSAAETAPKKVGKLKDIQNSSFYVIKLTSGDTVIHGVRKADASWRAKSKMIAAYFSDNQLALDTDPGFNISKFIDFFIVGDELLVCHKLNFESVLNYKQAHKEDFVELQVEPVFSAAFTSVELLVAHVGDNKIQLRRASAIRQKGHYKNAVFMQNLRNDHAAYGLQINFDDAGKIAPTAETCGDIFTALLDHRLISGFSKNIYDVPDTTDIAV